jgi:dolichol-phosphate mannosyltransferase
MDSDLSHNPKEISKFINLLDRYNFVQGSRYISGGKNNQPKLRYLLSYVGNKLIKIILNSELNEHTTSYRGFNINELKNFNLSKVKAGGYSFFMETIHRLKLDNFSMVEIPIIFNDRIYGQSKIPKIEIFRTLFNLIKISLKKII